MSHAATDLDRAPTHSLLAVLRVHDFRNLWLGLGLSSFGDWLGLLAITAMANKQSGQLSGILGGASQYQLQNFAIAGVLFVRIVPALVMGPLAGWVADRLDRRWTMIIGDYARALLFLSMPIVNTLWWVFVATVVIEAVSLVWGPAKDSTVPNIVPPHRLEAANQLSLATTYGTALPAALAFSAATLASQGITYTTGIFSGDPIQLALYFNALSFFVSGLVIQRLKTIPPGAAATHEEGPIRVIINGWRYVFGTPVVRGLVIGIIGAFAAGGVVIGLARTFVADLHGGDPGYGFMFAAVFLGLGSGMWRGPMLLQGLSRRRLFGLTLTAAGFMLVPLALVQQLPVAMAMAVVVGFFAGVAWVTGNTMLGLEVPDEWRGRTFAFLGSMIRLALSVVLAVGPLLAGFIGTHRIHLPNTSYYLVYNGAAWTFLIAGIVMLGVGVSSYRQMDDRRGISLASDLRGAFTSPGVYAATGVFVAFEGGEGSGKSTQTGLLAQWLEQEGYDVVRTFEPGDTAVGREMRRIVLDPATGDLSDRTETLLYAADKAEHVHSIVTPALARHAVVISDRYVDSTLAYQGAGRTLDVRQVERVARWATGDLRPHLTVVLDLPPVEGLGRFEGRDRIEGQSVDFHERVRDAFLRMASAKPEHYLVLDARLPKDVIAAQIRARLLPLLAQADRPAQDGHTLVVPPVGAGEQAPDSDPASASDQTVAVPGRGSTDTGSGGASTDSVPRGDA